MEDPMLSALACRMHGRVAVSSFEDKTGAGLLWPSTWLLFTVTICNIPLPSKFSPPVLSVPLQIAKVISDRIVASPFQWPRSQH